MTGVLATAAQGAKADTALQNAAAFATAAQGTKADSALQPAGNGSALTGLTKTQVGLANVDNTSDANKPVSTATQTALNAKAALATASAFPATSGTVALTMGDGVRTCTPTGDMTINASGGVAGDRCSLIFTTTGVTSRTITFGTNMRKTGTLATGTTAARFFTVTFVNVDGTIWQEESRTAVQT